MLELARTRPVFLLARPTGVAAYFPAVSGPPAWFLDAGQTLPDPRVRSYLDGPRLRETGPYSASARSAPWVRDAGA